MHSTPTTNVATTARLGVLAVLVGAAVAAAVIGSDGPAHAAPKAPAPNTNSGMHGDPAAAAAYWGYQQQDFDCAEMAVADVIGQISGHSPSEDEITGTAANIPSASHPGPIYTGGRTSNKDLVPLLAHYGVPADAVHPSTTDTLVRRLDQGRKMIVGVNDKILWNVPVDILWNVPRHAKTTSWSSSASTPEPTWCTSTTAASRPAATSRFRSTPSKRRGTPPITSPS